MPIKKQISKINKIFIIFIFIVSFIIILNSLSITFLFRDSKYVSEYREYYLFMKEYKPISLMTFGGATPRGYKIWILPLQKYKLLEKIKKDVEAELEDIILNNSDIFIEFKTSDDFKKIYLYYNTNDTIIKENPEIGRKAFKLSRKITDTILLKMELYYHISRGDGVSAYPQGETRIEIVPIKLSEK
ncbi:MAG: hypothetical protein AB9835_09225 [Eubacteriales bacterium]